MQPEIINQWDFVPPIMATLENLHDYADQVAAHSINEYGHCNSLWTIVREHSAQIVHTPWANEIEKRFQMDWMRETFGMDETVERYAFIGEVLLFDQYDEKTDTFHRKLDGLMVQTQQRDGRGLLKTYEVLELTWQKKGRVLLADDEFRGVDGPMTTLFQLSETMRFGGH